MRVPLSPTPRRPEWTTSESADRSRADACFALAEQASEQAGPARLVLVEAVAQTDPQAVRQSVVGQQL
jgi:hypothetical protein